MSKNLVKINLDKTSKLKFENVISGTEATTQSFLTIPLTERLSLTIKGKDTRENGKIISEIEIPPLKGFFNESKIIEEVSFNVKVSKSLFTPWKGVFELERPVEVDACLKETVVEEKKSEQPEIKTSLSDVEEYIEEACNRKKSTTSKKKKTRKKFSASKLTNDYL